MNTICFGQQPCGFFPKRFLVAKINTAKKIQAEVGGQIVFFYHDSDADYRETITVMRDKTSGAEVRLNFIQENKLQKKFSPLYLKRIPAGWKEEMLKQLPRFIPPSLALPTGETADSPPLAGGVSLPADSSDVALAKSEALAKAGEVGLMDIFKSTNQKTVADFCLEMYRKMGLLDGIEIVRSSDKNFRLKAPDLAGEFFADVEYQGEIVRAKVEYVTAATGRHMMEASGFRYKNTTGHLTGILHEGGDQFIRFPINQPIQKSQISAGRDRRFAWMQSVINCTHYIYGEGEKEYLDISQYSNIRFIDREKIDQPNYAWLE